MRCRFPATVVALLLMAAALTADPPKPAPDSDTQILYEVRIVTVPADSPLPNCPSKPGEVIFLTDAQAREHLEAVQGDPRANVLAAPRVTALPGQEAVVSNGQQQAFVTGLGATKVNGTVVLVPTSTMVDLGLTLKLTGAISADKKSTTTQVHFTERRLDGPAELVPVLYPITPVFEGGSQGKPVPVTQFLQVPKVDTLAVEAKIVVPSGGHAVIAGPTFTQEARVETKVPVLGDVVVLGRMFRNVGIGKVKMRTLLIVSPKVVEAPAPVADGATSDAVKLRNVAAADMPKMFEAYIAHNKLSVKVVAEPLSNSVLVEGEPAERKLVCDLLAKIDKPPAQFHMQMLFVKVPAGFARDCGIADGTEGTWVLTPREVRMFGVAIREAKARDGLEVLSRPQLQVSDNQTGFAQVGEENNGITARVTPRSGADGTPVLVRLETKITEPGEAVVVAGAGKLPAVNAQTTFTTAMVPVGGTFLVRVATGKKADGTATETLMLLTVSPVRTAK